MLVEGVNHPDGKFHQISGRIRRRGTDPWRVNKVWHVYGGFQDQSETITIGTINTWYHITNATNDLWTGTEADGFAFSGDVMTVTNTGDYIGILAITVAGSINKDYHFRVYNITQTRQEGYLCGATTTGATNFEQVLVPIYVEATAGDQLRMEVECTSNPVDDPIMEHAVFWMKYLHD